MKFRFARESWLSMAVEWNVWAHLCGTFFVSAIMSLPFFVLASPFPGIKGALVAILLGFLYEVWGGIPALHFNKTAPGFSPKDVGVNILGGAIFVGFSALISLHPSLYSLGHHLAWMSLVLFGLMSYIVVATLFLLSEVVARALEIYREMQDLSRAKKVATYDAKPQQEAPKTVEATGGK